MSRFVMLIKKNKMWHIFYKISKSVIDIHTTSATVTSLPPALIKWWLWNQTVTLSLSLYYPAFQALLIIHYFMEEPGGSKYSLYPSLDLEARIFHARDHSDISKLKWEWHFAISLLYAYSQKLMCLLILQLHWRYFWDE